MSRLQDQEGRRVRLPSHGITVTDVKPSGLMAIRPTVGPVHKSKEGFYQTKKGTGCISLSSVMVKAIKSALMEAAEHNGPADGKRRSCAGAKGRLQPKSAFCAKYNTASPTRAPCKKSMNNIILTPNANKKKGSGLTGKLELASRMNIEGVTSPRSSSAMELPTKKGRPVSPNQTKIQKKKPDASPTRSSRSPARKVQKDNSKRKSMIAVPAGSPDRKSSGSKKSTIHNDVSAIRTTQLPGCLESRSHLSAISLDSITYAPGKKQKQRIKPDMTNYEFMHKLMSYSSTSFRGVRNERRMAKIPTLDAIPEES